MWGKTNSAIRPLCVLPFANPPLVLAVNRCNLENNIAAKTYVLLHSVADPGGKSGHGPPSKLAMEFDPLGGRKSNDSIANLSKCKDFGPPYRCQLRIWPPTEK